MIQRFIDGSIAPSASTLLLLPLPLEIRNKIWVAVFGDRIIYLEYFEDDFEGEIIHSQ